MPVGVGTKPKGNLVTSDVLIEVKGKEQGRIKLYVIMDVLVEVKG